MSNILSCGAVSVSGTDFGLAWVGDISFVDTVIDPASANAFFTTENDGSVTGNDGQAADWRVPNEVNIGDDYEIRFDLVSGSSPSSSPTLGAWVTFPQTVVNNQSGIGSRTSEVRVQIRNKISQIVRVDVNVTVTATVDV